MVDEEHRELAKAMDGFQLSDTFEIWSRPMSCPEGYSPCENYGGCVYHTHYCHHDAFDGWHRFDYFERNPDAKDRWGDCHANVCADGYTYCPEANGCDINGGCEMDNCCAGNGCHNGTEPAYNPAFGCSYYLPGGPPCTDDNVKVYVDSQGGLQSCAHGVVEGLYIHTHLTPM